MVWCLYDDLWSPFIRFDDADDLHGFAQGGGIWGIGKLRKVGFNAPIDSRNKAENLSFWAGWGNSCRMPFDADKFLEDHPQYGLH